MRAQTPRRSRREIADALAVSIQQVDYWMARDRKEKAPRQPPRRAPKPPTSLDLRRRMRAFKNGDRSRRCRNPSCQRPFAPSNAHHALYRQHVRDEGGDEWDPDNALNLCQRCHDQHHSAREKIPLRSLRQNNIDFAACLLGNYKAYVYLHSYYSGDDPRVEKLVEIEAT